MGERMTVVPPFELHKIAIRGMLECHTTPHASPASPAFSLRSLASPYALRRGGKSLICPYPVDSRLRGNDVWVNE